MEGNPACVFYSNNLHWIVDPFHARLHVVSINVQFLFALLLSYTTGTQMQVGEPTMRVSSGLASAQTLGGKYEFRGEIGFLTSGFHFVYCCWK